jgi:redox-sensitive bicupin YhaK (pirin superfamily)
MGNSAVISAGQIQVMSAGTGITHSEFNNTNDTLKLLQIWVFPKVENVMPRYDELTLNETDRVNKFQQILSPNEKDAGVWIHQDAWFSLGKFDKNRKESYTVKKQNNGVYVFVISGSASINEQVINTRDGFGIWDTTSFDISILNDHTEILLMDVPMELPNHH